jgi:biopolymer transport protein ExbD
MNAQSERPIALWLLFGGMGVVLLLAVVTVGLAIVWYLTPSPDEGRMEFSLPAAGAARDRAPDKADRPQEIKAEITVVLKAFQSGADQGKVREIVVRSPQGETTVRGLDDLAAYLEKQRAALGNQTDILIQAETAVKYSHVIEAMDACVKAGFNQVGLAPPPDLKTD